MQVGSPVSVMLVMRFGTKRRLALLLSEQALGCFPI
jgi:hypothetical protein